MEKEEIKNTLLRSPLFNLSLSSKELFHSNFLAWLGEHYPAFFLAVFRELGCVFHCPDDGFTLKREYNNFDLCLLDSDGHILFILENKVKSMPRAGQLKEYEEKALAQQDHLPENLMLLSLVTEFPDKDIIERGAWKVRGYHHLGEAMRRHMDLLSCDPYPAALVKDYCMFIAGMHALAQSWYPNLSEPFLLSQEEKDFSQRLRVGDLQDKIRYSRVFGELSRMLGDTYRVTENADINAIKRDADYLHKVYVNFGFTHGQGLLEVKIKVSDDYVLLIQLQGNKYCHCIEWISQKQPASHQEAWKKTCGLEFLHRFLQLGESPAFFPSVCVDEPIQARKRKGEEPRIYNKYNNNFLYQAKKIKEDASIADVLKAMSEEVAFLISLPERFAK